jgi:hypothetical protein
VTKSEETGTRGARSTIESSLKLDEAAKDDFRAIHVPVTITVATASG